MSPGTARWLQRLEAITVETDRITCVVRAAERRAGWARREGDQ